MTDHFEIPQGSALTTAPSAARRHPTGDRVLSTLIQDGGLVGSIVAAFPGARTAGSMQWLDDWFLNLASRIHSGAQVPMAEPVAASLLAELSAGYDARCKLPFRINTVEPRYFRGFRVLAEPIILTADLVVIEGRNSHGKTSVAEALEWLFTGILSRRESGALGNARELEHCVANHFTPDGEKTAVEATLTLHTGVIIALRRELVVDYGRTTTSRCVSRLECDGVDLSENEERTLLDALLAGSPPLLMQHTLGTFIHSGPASRRQYFERLLQLEALTDLIEHAVMGARLASIPTPTGGVGRARWDALKAILKVRASSARVRNAEQATAADWATVIPNELAQIAALEFSEVVGIGASFEDAREALTIAQRDERERSFPLLAILRPTRSLDAEAGALFDAERVLEHQARILARAADLSAAQDAAAIVTAAELAIAEAVGILDRAGLVPKQLTATMPCPVCAHSEPPTLTPGRIDEIRKWEPARAALSAAERQLKESLVEAGRYLNQLVDARRSLLPQLPDQSWTPALESAPPAVATAASAFRGATRDIAAKMNSFDKAAVHLDAILQAGTPLDLAQFSASTSILLSTLDVVVPSAQEYIDHLQSLEDAIGHQAVEGDGYSQRDRWLDAASDTVAVARDFAWGRAVDSAEEILANVRAHLMSARQELLERHRLELTSGFKDVWATLREDRYSVFNQLVVPEPSGRGFKVEMQVKAQLDDGTTTAEVDALRVFSESQVNVLGIAAFVTRAKLLGHRTLMFDDPVQSMDEDHFKTFAGKLVPSLIEDGFQVVLLTHNDTFARAISYAHAERESYASVRISHARKSGCRVDLDNRRFSERLRRAEKAIDDSDFGEAWKVLRLAIERMYIVVFLKHGPPSFKPASWVSVQPVGQAGKREGGGWLVTWA